METLVLNQTECNFDVQELMTRIDDLKLNTDLYSLIVDEHLLSV